MQIQTQRLLLRDFTLEDLDAFVATRTEEGFWRYYNRPDDIEANAREQLELFVGSTAEEPRSNFQLAIVLKETGLLIGNCVLILRSRALFDGASELGYELDPRYWHLGYATEAARAMVDFGFETLKLHRVLATCNGDNEPSWRLMERLGMRREGVLRKNRRLRGEWRDTCMYGILAEEWKSSS